MKLLPILVLTLMFASCGKKEDKESKTDLTKTISCTVPASISSGEIQMQADCYREVSFDDDNYISLTLNDYDSMYYDLSGGALLMYEDFSKSNPIYFKPAGNNNDVYGTWKTDTIEVEGRSCVFTSIISTTDFTFSATCSI